VHWVCLIQKLAGSSCHFFFLEEKTFFFDQPKNLIRSAQFFVLVKPNFWAGRNWAGQTQILFPRKETEKIRVEKSGFNHFTCFETFFSLSAPGVGA
jgi:hypothetical protein